MMIDLKNKKELTFLAIGILMLIVVVLYSGAAIRFIIGSLGKVLNDKTENTQMSPAFQIEKAKELLK